MKIGILGSGDVGQALARACKAEGHEVMLATREPNSKKGRDLSEGLGIEVKDFAKVAKFAELVFSATRWDGTESALKLAGATNLAQKIVVDVTNPLDFSAGMPPKLALGHTDSGGEQVQRWLPSSFVVKALNTVGNQLMYKPDVGVATPVMLYCGNDSGAKQVVHTILLSFGWKPVDLGDITSSRELEPICITWVKYGVQTGSWHHIMTIVE